jgi:hypothetical protein
MISDSDGRWHLAQARDSAKIEEEQAYVAEVSAAGNHDPVRPGSPQAQVFIG